MLLSLTVLWVDAAQMMGLGFFWWFLLGSLLWCSWMQLGMESYGLNGDAEMVGSSPHVVSGPLQERILMWLLRAPKTQKHSLPGCLMPGLWIPKTALLVPLCSFNQITGGQKLDVGGDYTRTRRPGDMLYWGPASETVFPFTYEKAVPLRVKKLSQSHRASKKYCRTRIQSQAPWVSEFGNFTSTSVLTFKSHEKFLK